ncbi:MAG: ABC transporter substrate-binding protein [Thermoproteota archaeon]|nr:ABC transporter substrate-binding protein [Thermoproteota archaeon]
MKISITSLLLFILFSSIYINFNNYSLASSSSTTGGYLDELKFIRYSNDNIAYQEVSNGNLDTYLSHIPLQLIDDAKKNLNLKIYNKDGLSYGLLMNPSNNSQSFNPFSIRELRYALNFLIDRNFIVNDVLKGFGNSIVEPYGQYSPEYPNIINVVDPLKIKYDPEFALTLISDSMKKVGAVMDNNGKWNINGKPVIIKILIRNDDPLRKTFGDLVASELDKSGFSIIKDYGDLTKANQVVYGSNPKDLNWNIYTESYISGSFLRYNPSAVAQMYAPWLGNMPGFQNPAFWQYSNLTIDNLTKKLIFNNFTSKEERNDLLKKAESIGIQESVRLFFVRSDDPYITSNKISGLVNDYSSGIANELSFMNAQKNGSGNNTLNIGLNQIYQGAWNNVDGCKDFYCKIINSVISDNAILLNPYTGDPMPFRNNWTDINSNGPNDKIVVPHDVIIWNPYNQTWKLNDDNNKTALTKIKTNPLYSKWHNGVPVDKYDLLYPFYFQYEWSIDTKNNDRTFDAEYSSSILPSLPLIKGIKFNNDDTFESYIDIWHYDKKQLALSGTLWAAEPWEITAATERLVSDNKLSYSKTDSNIKQNEQLSLILPSHAELIKQELEKMKQEKFIPNPLKGLVSLDYVLNRYDSSIQWINLHHNAVIGNGPYYLDSFNPVGGIVILKKFNDNTYPFKKGYFSNFENPPKLIIDKINVPKFIKIGSPYKFDFRVNFENGINKTKPFNGIINYIISDRNDKVVINNSLNSSKDSTVSIANKFSTAFQNNVINNSNQISLQIGPSKTKLLSPGPAKLELFVTSTDSMRPTIYDYTLIARP